MSVPRQGALHDIRNIIATLRLLSESLEENRDKSVALKAERMTRCIDRCVSACNAELSGPGRTTVGAAFCLRDLLRDLRDDFSELSPGRLRLAPCNAMAGGRATDIYRIAFNLLQNALCATRDRPAGAVSLDVHIAGGRLDLRIADNGPGLPEAVCRTLSGCGADIGRGQLHGIGLTSCMALARRNAADLRVIATGPEGTTIGLRLAPVEVSEAARLNRVA